MRNKVYFSFIVPVYNEQETVVALFQEIKSAAAELKKPGEIIFVNDGSTDQTLQILKALSPIKIISLRKNFGQSAALDAGIKNAQGEVIITLDGDGQNNPEDIPKLLKKLNEGYDAVCGWRHPRQDPFLKKFVSSGAELLGRFLVNDGVHDSGCTLRVYKRECFDDLDLYGELHRMIPALLRWRGFKITEVKVSHRPRKFGKSKYDWKRMVKGFLDMTEVWFLRKYESRPLHLFGSAGLVLLFFSSLFGVYLFVRRLFFNYSLADKIWPLIAVTGFISGVQFLIFGLLADLIIRSRSKKVFYRVKEIHENKPV